MTETGRPRANESPARTPAPPYVAVIFSSIRAEGEDDVYAAVSERMEDLAREQPGFLGMETARDAAGLGITVSYWDSLEAAVRWREHAEHAEARRAGRERWYEQFRVRVCEVRREYGAAPRSPGDGA